jgi:hypothetical protein
MVRRQLSHVVTIPNLLNKKNSFRKIWNVQKIIAIFAKQKNRHATDTITHNNREKV